MGNVKNESDRCAICLEGFTSDNPRFAVRHRYDQLVNVVRILGSGSISNDDRIEALRLALAQDMPCMAKHLMEGGSFPGQMRQKPKRIIDAYEKRQIAQLSHNKHCVIL
jgi:hypothetical protein